MQEFVHLRISADHDKVDGLSANDAILINGKGFSIVKSLLFECSVLFLILTNFRKMVVLIKSANQFYQKENNIKVSGI